MTIHFETARLQIRPFVESDLDDLARIYADPEVMRYIPPGPLDRQATAEELAWHVAGGEPDRPGYCLAAAILKDNGRLAGRCGLLAWTIDGADEVEIAYLVDRPHWGRGLGREMAAGLVDLGFNRRGHDRLIALVHPGNTASIRTAEGAGLSLERALEGEFAPFRLYAIGRGEPAGRHSHPQRL